MSQYYGDIDLGDTIQWKFTTVNSSGVPTILTGSPTATAYTNGGLTQSATGVTLTADFDSVTGLNQISVVATSGNGFAAGENIEIVIDAGTVDGNTVVGYAIGSFSVSNRSPLRPTTIGRTLDVAATGEAGMDLGNVVGVLGNANVGWIDGNDRVDVGVWLGTAVTLSTGNKPDVNVDEWADVLLATTNPLPNAVPGAAGGVFIAGTNAATTVTTSFTTTFTGSLTGNVNGNVAGTVGSVVTKTGYALASTGADLILKSSTFALAMADAIWDEPMAGHVTADTAGLGMNDWQDGGRLDVILDARMAEASITTSGGAVSTVTAVTNDVGITSTAVNLIWDESMVETTGAPAITGSMRLFMSWWAALSRNVVNQTATTSTLRNDADGADLSTSTVSDDGSEFVRGEWTT